MSASPLTINNEVVFSEFLYHYKSLCSDEQSFTINGALRVDEEKCKEPGTTKVFEEIKKKAMQLRSGTNDNIVCVADQTELELLLIYLTNYSYFKDNQLDAKEYLNPKFAKMAFEDKMFIDGNAEVLKGITTHNLKLVNPQAKTARLLCDTHKHEIEGVAGCNITLIKEYDYAGNAKYLKVSNLMISTFLFEGECWSVFKAIEKKNQLIIDMVDNIAGFPFCQQMMTVLYRLGEEDPIIPSLQLLIPVKNRDYVAITPTVNVGFSRIFRDKITAFNAAENDLFARFDKLKIGGDKPQNAGMFNSSIGGNHKTLKAKFFRIEEDELTKKFKYAKTLVNVNNAELHKLITMETEHFQQKQGFRSCIQFWLRDVLRDLYSACQAFKGDSETIAHKLRPVEYLLITGQLNKSDVEACADHLLNMITLQANRHIQDSNLTEFKLDVLKYHLEKEIRLLGVVA